MCSPIIISQSTLRRFILGQQGLWPGRRWRGAAGVAAALEHGSVVQIDPLNLIARSHDTALYGRVLDYTPSMLDELMYMERAAFDYGGTLFVHPMAELPYWRVVMERNAQKGRWAAFAEQHRAVLEIVRAEIAARDPLAGRDFTGSKVGPGNYRGSKDTGLALYNLWFSGELMTAGRNNKPGASGGKFDRLYDLRERVAPPAYQHAAPLEDCETFFALKTFYRLGLPTARDFRLGWSGAIERPVSEPEAGERISALIAAGQIYPLSVEGQPASQPRYALAEELAHLETLQAGRVPDDWLPLESSTEQEMTVLAPLEIVSARGRAKSLFGFEYLWEVYKPAEQRRWGYYTMPLLWGDRLAARFDSRLERAGRALHILGFWVEPWVTVDAPFRAALHAGLKRFMDFIGADWIIDRGLLP